MKRFQALPRWAKIVLPIGAALVLCVCGLVSLDLILPDAEPTPPRLAELPTDAPDPTDTLPPPTNTLPPPTDTLPPPTDTPAPTATPDPTDTPGPTPTPRPTLTNPPTLTPLPTNTPNPTDTPGPTPTPAPTKEPRPKVIIANVYNDGYIERVTIRNDGDAPADLSGWTVSGSKGDETFHFPGGYILPAGVAMRLHSGDDGIEDPPYDIWWTTKTVWNNSGETASLKDAGGNLIDSFTW